MAPAIGDLTGLWCRTLYKRRWRRADRSTDVFWLQGARLFADLRQPPDRPDFTGVHCLRQLHVPHLKWLARQQGFAGHLTVTGGIAEWHRALDFQPNSGGADRARIRFKGAVLREDGTEAAYHELWERQDAPAAPCWGLRLIDDASGVEAILVRVGPHFMLARSRPQPLKGDGDLLHRMEAMPRLEDRQDLIDCEIALGWIDPGDGLWHIARSSLPFKEGTILRFGTGAADGSRLHWADINAEGAPIVRTWRIVENDGDGPRDDLAAGRQAEAL